MEKIIIKKNHDKRVRFGHLWIFSNELISIPKFEPGTIVEVENQSGEKFGLAYFNPHTLIAARLLKTSNDINEEFFLQRILSCKQLREQLYPDEPCYRLVYSETDALPGLVIDKYENYFSIQILTAGMYRLKDLMLSALLSIFPQTEGIILKNNSKLSELETEQQEDTILFGKIPQEIITKESDIKLSISLISSQKTGYFLDQRDNRLFLRKFVKNKKVLDCYCNQGGFALNTAYAGASETIGIDSSAPVIERANRNAELNSFPNCNFIQSEVEPFLIEQIDKHKSWDLIILDPPAFTKTHSALPKAIAGYKKINRLALKLISKGGFLATSSCSHHVDEETFLEIATHAAYKAGRQLQLIWSGNQASDHPIMPEMPETKYLKFLVFRVM
jgi:23S rRNA (cytosine1962-C5)-methyltransferase